MFCRLVLVALVLSTGPAGFAVDTPRPRLSESYDFAEPKLLTATLYELGSEQKKMLYTFRRTATRSGATVNVEREFFGTNS